jgi:hypothetical protein
LGVALPWFAEHWGGSTDPMNDERQIRQGHIQRGLHR